MEPLLVDEGEEGNPLPGVLLPVQVDLEVERIEVDDGSHRVDHKLAPNVRYVVSEYDNMIICGALVKLFLSVFFFWFCSLIYLFLSLSHIIS